MLDDSRAALPSARAKKRRLATTSCNGVLQLLRRQPNRSTVFAWLRAVAIREAWRLDRSLTLDAAIPEHLRAKVRVAAHWRVVNACKTVTVPQAIDT